MKPWTLGVAVTDMGARSDFARHVPAESAAHTRLFAWISQTSSGLRSVLVRDFLSAADGPPITRRRLSTRSARRSRMQARAMRRLQSAESLRGATLAFLGTSSRIVLHAGDNLVCA